MTLYKRRNKITHIIIVAFQNCLECRPPSCYRRYILCSMIRVDDELVGKARFSVCCYIVVWLDRKLGAGFQSSAWV